MKGITQTVHELHLQHRNVLRAGAVPHALQGPQRQGVRFPLRRHPLLLRASELEAQCHAPTASTAGEAMPDCCLAVTYGRAMLHAPCRRAGRRRTTAAAPASGRPSSQARPATCLLPPAATDCTVGLRHKNAGRCMFSTWSACRRPVSGRTIESASMMASRHEILIECERNTNSPTLCGAWQEQHLDDWQQLKSEVRVAREGQQRREYAPASCSVRQHVVQLHQTRQARLRPIIGLRSTAQVLAVGKAG